MYRQPKYLSSEPARLRTEPNQARTSLPRSFTRRSGQTVASKFQLHVTVTRRYLRCCCGYKYNHAMTCEPFPPIRACPKLRRSRSILAVPLIHLALNTAEASRHIVPPHFEPPEFSQAKAEAPPMGFAFVLGVAPAAEEAGAGV